MNVDFNELRVRILRSYESLVHKLNAAISEDAHPEFMMVNYNPDQKEPRYSPHITIGVNDIKDDIEDLRRNIALIALCEDDENPEIRNVFSEVFPNNEMTLFNPEKEEE
jgi:hypothetical protein